MLVILAWFIYTGVRALWARVLPPCLLGPILPRVRLMCGNVVLTVLSAGPLLLMLTGACALSGDVVLTASQGCIDLPEGSAAVNVERGFLCCECGCALATVGACILLEPWRSARCVHSGCCMGFHTRPRLLWHLMYSVSSRLAAYSSFFTPCDDATVDAAEYSDRVESRALRRAGEYDRVARMPAVRVHGCTLPPSAHGPDGLRDVLPPRVPDDHDGRAQRAPVSVHRHLDVTVYSVLHFFSGQRRPGDFQDWLDQSLAVTHFPVWAIRKS